MVDTDTFRFDSSAMFAALRKSFLSSQMSGNNKQTQNLIDSKDDMIYAWNLVDCCVYALNWRMAKTKEPDAIKYQILQPSATQNFIVEKISVSHEGSFLALSGPRGIAMLEFPRRWGPNGQYQNGKSSIICSSHNLDERFFISNSNIKVLQVRWHPASPNDSQLIVLLSNNSIRVYDETKLRHVWRVGPIPCAQPPTGAQLSYLNSLGDTAVDFDIAPPRVVMSTDNGKDVSFSLINESQVAASKSTTENVGKKVEWPLVLLRGNGTIYVVLIGTDTEKPCIQGPLTMFPQTIDNYGDDSCSILILPTLPPTIVIAESTGKLHHALFLETECFNKSFREIDTSLTISSSEWDIYILESVELELGLAEWLNDKQTTCPIYMKRDPINENRYFAYHNTGLHTITFNATQQLQNFVDSTDNNLENVNLFGNPSHLEYLVCTKALNSTEPNPIIGITFLQSPAGLVLLLASGQVVSFNLIADVLRDCLPNTTSTKLTKSLSTTSKVYSNSFETTIRNILQSDCTQPLLKLNKSTEPTARELLELLIQSTQSVREEQFVKLDKAREEIQKRVKLLNHLKQQQQQDIAQLLIEKDRIRANAERLAELYEDTCDKQQVLFRRAQECVRLVVSNAPHVALAEEEFKGKIVKINELTKVLAKNVSAAKQLMSRQEAQMEKSQAESKQNKVVLQPKVESTIKELISELTQEIDGEIKDIKRIKSVLNISS